MSLKNVKRLLAGLSLAALIIAIISQNSAISTVLVLACVVASLAILYPNLAKLSNVSEDNPKARTLKGVTIFIAVYLGIIVLFATAAEKGVFDRFVSEISEAKLITYSKFMMALLLAVPMLFFGNIAPKIPFNRYTGLRLPWTVRDEDTWIVAHRVLGYISAPIAILLFANVATDMPLDTYVKFWWLGAVILWIAIPGIISGVFYYKKWNGKL